MKIGVLALQGSVKEHIEILKRCGVETVLVKKADDVIDICGLIIPGGESTTIAKLIEENDLDKEIIKKHKKGMPIYGSCAGAIILAKEITNSKQPKLGLMDISISRNKYGRQIDSFETLLEVPILGKPFRGVFIRAPVIENVYDGVEVMASFMDNPVLVKQGNLLVSTFHPELTDDKRVHEYFIGMVKNT